MKRSKLFLVTTTALLAVAGVFAAKAHRFVNVTGYTSQGGTANLCTRAVSGKLSVIPHDAQLAVTSYNQCSSTPLFTTTAD